MCTVPYLINIYYMLCAQDASVAATRPARFQCAANFNNVSFVSVFKCVYNVCLKCLLSY